MTEDQVAGGIPAQLAQAHDLPPVIGVDLGGTQLRVAVMRGAHLLSRIALLTGDDPAPERILPRIGDAIEQALSEANITLDEVLGIGVGAPGPLNNRTGVIYRPPNLPGWEDVPVRDILMERFKTYIFVENDAHTAALGEFLFGSGYGTQDMVYMTVSTGIGGGIIVKGKILEGTSGTAGELGHMTIDMHGELCNCGNLGCLEVIASGTAIARRANRAIEAGQGADLLNFALSLAPERPEAAPVQTAEATQHVSARVVGEAARAGIPLAQEIIATAAEGLGVGLVNVIHIFNPEMIILGGGVTQMGDLILNPALRIVQERAMHVPRDAVRIVLAELGPNVGLVGAGALIYYHHYHTPDSMADGTK